MEQRDGLLTVASVQDSMSSIDPLRRAMAQMLAMVGAAVPATSLSAEPLDADGSSTGGSVVYRSASLRVSPIQVRREYLTRYWSEDPFHASQVVGGSDTVRGTFEQPDFQRRSNLFLEYAREVDLPHFLRVFVRLDHQLVAHLFLGRTHAQRPFSTRELTFLRRVVPFLETAYAAAARPAPAVHGEALLSGAGLTRREADVARYASTGMRTREIADTLVLTEATIKSHLASVYRKLDVRGRAELAARLAESGSPSSPHHPND